MRTRIFILIFTALLFLLLLLMLTRVIPVVPVTKTVCWLRRPA